MPTETQSRSSIATTTATNRTTTTATNRTTSTTTATTASTSTTTRKSRPFYTLYLDIETYSPDGISPDALILSIGTLLEVTSPNPSRSTSSAPQYHTARRLKIFSTYYPTTSPGDITTLVKNERNALASFYTYYTRILKEARENNAILHVVGWNIINYDLPILYHRLYDYSIEDPARLFANLFHYPHIVDLRQIYIFLNQFRLTGSSMSALLSTVYNVERNSQGSEIADFVLSGSWSAIDDHLTADLLTIRQIHKDLKALSRSPAFLTAATSDLTHIAKQSRSYIEAAHHISDLRPLLDNRNNNR